VVTGVDLLPTLCAAAGIELPVDDQGDGENLLAALRGKPVQRTRPIFWQWTGFGGEPDWWPRLAVRDGDWKLLLDPEKDRAELYRLTDDRAESRDLAKEQPERVDRLRRMALACIGKAGRENLETRFKGLDRDGDGRLSKDDFVNRAARAKAGK
jgi:N-acetylgalactosamine-6-sulfatase